MERSKRGRRRGLSRHRSQRDHRTPRSERITAKRLHLSKQYHSHRTRLVAKVELRSERVPKRAEPAKSDVDVGGESERGGGGESEQIEGCTYRVA